MKLGRLALAGLITIGVNLKQKPSVSFICIEVSIPLPPQGCFILAPG